jgi:acetyl-CoA carboxylase biotin carboxyl carrier protein
VTSEPSDPVLAYTGISEAHLAAVLELVAGTDVVELDLVVGGSKLKLRRPASAPAAFEPTLPPTVRAALDAGALAVSSPLVGIFHPAVKPGDAVSHGQVIGAIEALGMPTSVDAPQAGTIAELLVQDGAPVEYGQPLLLLRKPVHS